MATIDKYKALQENIAKRKANLQAQGATNTQSVLPDAISPEQTIPNQTTSLPAWGNPPTQMPLNAINEPQPVTPQPVASPVVTPTPETPTPPVAPVPPVSPVTATPSVVPEKTPEQLQIERNKAYTDAKKLRLQTQADNKLRSNMSIYSTGKNLYDAVKGGSILPWSKEFSDLTGNNPNLLADYNNEKAKVDKAETVKTLGQAILGETPPPQPSNTLQTLIDFYTKSMDTDIAWEYQTVVKNNPEYLASVEKFNGINSQIAENNKNITALSDDVRKKYSAWTPESLIASAIAREAKPLIENGKYLSELQNNAQAEMTRIFDDNKELFTIKQQERNDKNQKMIDLYGTIRSEEIRQEDFARADKKLADEIARTDKKDKQTLDRLDQDRLDNVKEAIVKLGWTVKGTTYDELLSDYATAVKNQPTESKTISGLKPWEVIYKDGKFITVPWGQGGTQASWNLVSINTGNKNVQVDSVAANWLQSAIQSMQAAWINVVTWQAARDQAATIKAMWDRVGMPWATAAQLRAAWHQIADVWSSKHENGMAIDLYSNDKFGAPTQEQIDIMAQNWWYHPNIPWDAGHFEYVGTQSTTIDPTIESILNWALNIKDLPTDQRTEVANKVNAYLNEQTKNISDKDEAAIMRSAVYTKGMSDTTMQKIGKINTVRQQLWDITTLLNKESTWPLIGILKSNNPYDTKAQQIKTAIQALVPNLARWVFWEVGVLTDSDIENYSKTVPNLKSTAELNDAILEMINKTLGRTFSDTIATAAKNKENVSQFIDDYRTNKWSTSQWTPQKRNIDATEMLDVQSQIFDLKKEWKSKAEIAKALIAEWLDPLMFNY